MFTYVVFKKLKRGGELMRTLMSLFTILVIVFVQGCGFSKLKQDLKKLETVSTISGTIICESPRT
jgi:outer membrane lipoprotein-sorting protein